MPLNNLKSNPIASRKRKKLVGRGSGSGHGKTSTRGSNGQKSRSGRDFYLGFEGGQSPLIRRMPKRGFNHTSKIEYQLVNIRSLNGFENDAVVDSKVLEEKGLIKQAEKPVKILGTGELKKKLTIKAANFSEGAVKLIEKAGGVAEVVK